ncbi:response regulator [Natrinema sp. 1APR25-10V2]|uniref:response regulator n=1 Tax=Natrinema sp. 1APR25-10V2 TaxID=2951081 RepID=UPI002876D2BB|nr:response regulator [Natrinema sp. 1APR25-10V2]MDS0475997.1 response regulator [Natrinema sp. 1APR25-10V2]
MTTDPSATGADQATSSGPEASPIEILLIEANHGDVRLIRERFVDAGILNDLHVVYDGDEALDFVHQRGDYTDASVPDIVLLDLKLPGGRSEDVLATLDDQSEFDRIPVIGMTNSPTETDIAQSRGFDPDGYIHQPFDPGEFLDIVREFEGFDLLLVKKSSSETV